MSVAQLHPDPEEGDLAKGFTVPRDTAFFRHSGRRKYRLSVSAAAAGDVTLWPLAIEEVRLTAAPPDMPALHRSLPANIHVAGALRITLRTFGELTFSQFAGLDRLPVLSLWRGAHGLTPVRTATYQRHRDLGWHSGAF